MKIPRYLRSLTLCVVSIGCAAELTLFDSSGDIGETRQKGKVEFDNSKGEYRVTGSGANMWAGSDAFHFVWKKMSGDVALTADVHFLGTGVDPHRKAALMIRQNLEPSSAYADVAVHGDGLTSLQFRPADAAMTQEVRSALNGPVRLRIERRGNQFMMYAGNPGEALTPAGPATVAVQDPVYVGLAVCSHNVDVLETAVFSNVRVEALPPQAAPQKPSRPRYSSKVTIFTLADRSTRTVYQEDEIVEAPNWSRDGRFLLVNSRGRLLRVSVDGTATTPEPVNLDPSLRCNNDHDFSPDGKQIAISASSPSSRQSQVYVADADGSNLRLVVPTAPAYFHGWSPDGKWLAFVGQRDGKYELFRAPASGGPEERLTSKGAYDDGPDYSPDGKWIYFNSDRSGNWDIWRIPSSGAGPGDAKAEQVTNDPLEDWFPHPSPDGQWLLIFSFPEGTKGHNDRMEGVQLRLIPMPGRSIKRTKPDVLTTFFGGQGTINVNSWSPDSKRFAYVVYEPLKEGAAQ